MRHQPAASVFLISGRSAYRADFAQADGDTTGFDAIDTEPGTATRAVVETLLRRGGAAGRRALVCCHEIWLHLIKLPAAGLAGLSADEIQLALQYEVESLTGLSVEELALVSRRLSDRGGEARFWVAVTSRTIIDEIIQALQASGARTVSVCHPAGITRHPSGSNPSDERFEYWPSLVVDFGEDGGELAAILQGGGAVQKWRDEQLMLMGGARVLWGPGGDAPPALERGRLRSLKDDAVGLKAWAAAAVRSDRLAVPQWTKSRSIPASRRRILTALVATVIAAAAVGFHWRWLDERGRTLSAAIALQQQWNADQEASDAELLRLANERSQLQETADRAEDQLQLLHYFLDHQVGRLDKLLTWLLHLRTEDLLIRELRPHERGMSILGMSLNSESAPQLANQLRDLAQPLGWRVNLSAQIGAKTLVSGGPWEFEIVLEDAGWKSDSGVWLEAQQRAARVARFPPSEGAKHAP